VLAAMAANPLVPFVVGVVIGVPSALLYLLQALVIVFRRKTAEFRSSFYRLVVLRAGIVSPLFKTEREDVFIVIVPRLFSPTCLLL
jgi:hypothetical protein